MTSSLSNEHSIDVGEKSLGGWRAGLDKRIMSSSVEVLPKDPDVRYTHTHTHTEGIRHCYMVD